jgi:hypothetical protein
MRQRAPGLPGRRGCVKTKRGRLKAAPPEGPTGGSLTRLEAVGGLPCLEASNIGGERERVGCTPPGRTGQGAPQGCLDDVGPPYAWRPAVGPKARADILKREGGVKRALGFGLSLGPHVPHPD